jgi:hypothetical protein
MVYGLEATHPLATDFLPRSNLIRFLAKIQTNLFESIPYIYAPSAIALEDLDLEDIHNAKKVTETLRRVWLELHLTASKKFSIWLKP